MIVRTQKSKYQPYSFKKSAIGSPCVSPRSLSPPLESRRERLPANIASIPPLEAQRKLNEIAIKQFFNVGSKDNNYGPLTRQLATGSTVDRPVKDQKAEELKKQVDLYQLASVLIKQQQFASSIGQADRNMTEQSMMGRRSSNSRQRIVKLKEFSQSAKQKIERQHTDSMKSRRASRGVLTPTKPSNTKTPAGPKIFESVGMESQLRKTKSNNKK